MYNSLSHIPSQLDYKNNDEHILYTPIHPT